MSAVTLSTTWPLLYATSAGFSLATSAMRHTKRATRQGSNNLYATVVNKPIDLILRRLVLSKWSRGKFASESSQMSLMKRVAVRSWRLMTLTSWDSGANFQSAPQSWLTARWLTNDSTIIANLDPTNARSVVRLYLIAWEITTSTMNALRRRLHVITANKMSMSRS